MRVQYQITIYGRVQGVGFRYAARNQARLLNLKGWVENRPDGSVYSVVNGNHQACMKFIDWCKSGTGYSWVERVDIQEMELAELNSFTIRH